jgi:peptide/nickel transport system permease protein
MMTTVYPEDIQQKIRSLTHEQLPPKSRYPAWLRTMFKSPVSILGVILLVFFIAVAALAPLLAPPRIPSQPYVMMREGFQAQPQPPSLKHPLGTTQGQYDILYGVVWGTRTAFKVGLIVTGITLLIGGGLGAIFAYMGGVMDEGFQRIVELFLAFPFLLAAITMATILGPKIRNGLITAMIALIVFGWPSYARLIRGDILSVKEREYITAAHMVGVPGWRILMKHVLPNSIYSLLVVASLDIGSYVLTFAALSFLGLGAPLGYADWGQLLSFARNWIPNLSDYWYIVVYPGMALLLFVLAWNLLGDAFRDALDPKMRGDMRR